MKCHNGEPTAGRQPRIQSGDGRLADLELPSGVNTAVTGQSEEWETSQRSLVFALALSVFLVYVIMASQFESLVYPLIILVTIPLALVGVVLALVLLDMPVSVVVFLGGIMLAGIVVNNAIVLVDYVNQLKDRGYATDEALETAGAVRLRPILMTTLTTVLGLLPMALGGGDGAEIRQPMALDPARRGAADVSFVAPYTDALAGLGALGKGGHSPNESLDYMVARHVRGAVALVFELERLPQIDPPL